MMILAGIIPPYYVCKPGLGLIEELAKIYGFLSVYGRTSRPAQIFRHTLSPGTCLKSSGQVRRVNEESRFYPSPSKLKSYCYTLIIKITS